MAVALAMVVAMPFVRRPPVAVVLVVMLVTVRLTAVRMPVGMAAVVPSAAAVVIAPPAVVAFWPILPGSNAAILGDTRLLLHRSTGTHANAVLPPTDGICAVEIAATHLEEWVDTQV
jgi:hypothetical protein